MLGHLRHQSHPMTRRNSVSVETLEHDSSKLGSQTSLTLAIADVTGPNLVCD